MRTPSQTVGPYYAIGLCRRPANELAPDGVELTGQLLDGQCAPIGDGMLELWDPVRRRWGRSGTDADGRFAFRVRRDALTRIGLPEVRQHRLKRPDEEERAWAADLPKRDRILPDLQPVVILRVEP